MARCERCLTCESMWDTVNCAYCNYPDVDTRNAETIAEDNKFYAEWLDINEGE